MGVLPTGRYLVTGSDDTRILLFDRHGSVKLDLDSGHVLNIFSAHCLSQCVQDGVYVSCGTLPEAGIAKLAADGWYIASGSTGVGALTDHRLHVPTRSPQYPATSLTHAPPTPHARRCSCVRRVGQRFAVYVFDCPPGLDGRVIVNRVKPDGSAAFSILARHRGAAHRLALFPTSFTQFMSVGEDGCAILYDTRER